VAIQARSKGLTLGLVRFGRRARAGAVRRRAIRGFSGWPGLGAATTISTHRKEITDMDHDLIIGGAMALASVIASLAIVLRIARVVREAPEIEPVTPAGTVPALRPTQGW
jgi:hypothetical protein